MQLPQPPRQTRELLRLGRLELRELELVAALFQLQPRSEVCRYGRCITLNCTLVYRVTGKEYNLEHLSMDLVK